MRQDLLYYLLERLATHGDGKTMLWVINNPSDVEDVLKQFRKLDAAYVYDRSNNTAVVYGCTIKFLTHNVCNYKIRGLVFDNIFIDESSEIH